MTALALLYALWLLYVLVMGLYRAKLQGRLSRVALVLGSFVCVLGQAHASCIPANLGGTGSNLVYSENGRGCWVGWWCPAADPQTKWHAQPYIAAAVKSRCGLVGTRRDLWAWVQKPTVSGLRFGADPHTDPALRAVWWSERAKLEAVK